MSRFEATKCSLAQNRQRAFWNILLLPTVHQCSLCNSVLPTYQQCPIWTEAYSQTYMCFQRLLREQERALVLLYIPRTEDPICSCSHWPGSLVVSCSRPLSSPKFFCLEPGLSTLVSIRPKCGSLLSTLSLSIVELSISKGQIDLTNIQTFTF